MRACTCALHYKRFFRTKTVVFLNTNVIQLIKIKLQQNSKNKNNLQLRFFRILIHYVSSDRGAINRFFNNSVIKQTTIINDQNSDNVLIVFLTRHTHPIQTNRFNDLCCFFIYYNSSFINQAIIPTFQQHLSSQ